MVPQIKNMSKKKLAILTIIPAIILDQVMKISVKPHYTLGDGVPVFSWFQTHSTENNGMVRRHISII